MLPFFTEHWGTPITPHLKGQELYPYLTEYYKAIYTLLGADENDQIILTSSGAEAVNHVISSVYRDLTMSSGKNQFLTSISDEAPAIMAAGQLEKFGCIHKSILVDHGGKINRQTLCDALSPRTALVSLSWANGLTGVIQPISEIAEICQQRGIRLHLDATHVLGKLYFELNEIKADYITFNGTQLHGPQGIGGLYIKQGIRCSSFIAGGSDQAGLRAGQLNMPGLAGLACAAQEALDSLDLLCTETARLRNKLENGIKRVFPRAQFCFKGQERLPHCTTILFPGIANEAMLFLLNRKKLCASIGGGNFQQLALILTASGIEENLAHSALSFSLSRYTTDEEVDRAIDIIGQSALELTAISNHIIHPDIGPK
jgi:cysteine desulfurase